MRLDTVLAMATPGLGRAAGRMWAGITTSERYLDWLAVCHDLVRATAPLLSEAVGECVRRDEHRLAGYFAEQLQAETGHDTWVEQDYLTAGGDPARLAGRIPSPNAARLVGAQYYYLRHAHPIALTGHIAVLEWYPPHPALVSRLIAQTGLPRTAFRTLQRHVELDHEHRELLVKLLGEHPVDERRWQLIGTSALTTTLGLIELMNDLGGLP